MINQVVTKTVRRFEPSTAEPVRVHPELPVDLPEVSPGDSISAGHELRFVLQVH